MTMRAEERESTEPAATIASAVALQAGGELGGQVAEDHASSASNSQQSEAAV